MMTNPLRSRYISLVPKTSSSMYLDERTRSDMRWAAETLGISMASIVTLAVGEYVRKLRAERAPIRAETPAPKRKR